MATQILHQPRRIVLYLPNLRSAMKHLRTFSSYNERKFSNSFVVVNSSDPEDSETVWPDKLGVLGHADTRFTLPGLVGASRSLNPKHMGLKSTEEITLEVPDVLSEQMPHERHAEIIGQYKNQVMQETEDIEHILMRSIPDSLECQAIECSDKARKDFSSLFPDRDLSSSPLVVMAISQKTENCMTSWTQEVELERDELTQLFVSGAKDIVKMLEEAGFWADFIDPVSGTPFYGCHVNTIFYETDERYKHFGFDIEDLGCCKVLQHPVWGTHSFVGCLFTDAPLDHPVVKHLMDKSSWAEIQ